jgi:hypothetical protein
MLPLGVLIFAVGTLVVVNLWALIDAKLSVSAASREAIRTVVEAPDLESGIARGEMAARQAMSRGGGRPERLELTWRSGSGSDTDTDFTRCRRLIVRASYRMPALALPWLGGLGAVDVNGTASELVDPYRDGLSGVACAH